jgi:IMP dehydrogenase/GMP reductase
MKFNRAYSFDDLLLVPKYSEVVSRSLVSTVVDLGKGFIFDIPIISSNMTNVTEVAMAVALTEAKGLAILHRFCSIEEQVRMFQDCVSQNINATKHVGASIGVKEEDKTRLAYLVSAGCKIICIDVAHGYSKVALDMTRYVADKYPEVLLISGNAAEGHGAVTIARAGADVVKVGVGGGCFAAGTRILMHSGQYKNIEDVIPGDKIINMHGKPVEVINAVCTGKKQVLKVKYNTGFETFVTKDHLFLLSSVEHKKQRQDYKKYLNNNFDPKWTEISEGANCISLLPSKLDLSLNETFEISLYKRNYIDNGQEDYSQVLDKKLTPSYELGYVFGTFLGDGHAFNANYKNSNIGSVFWYFSLNELDKVEKLKKCISQITDKELTFKKQKSIYHCRLYYKPFADFLASFGKRYEKHLPEQFLIKDLNYLKGLADGLFDSDGHTESYGRKRFSNTSQKLVELMFIINYLINNSFGSLSNKKATAGNLKNCNIDNCRDSYVFGLGNKNSIKNIENYSYSKITSVEDLGKEDLVYDLEVDCPSHSFIANNAIVHNSICTTRIQTGNGVPMLTAIESTFQAREKSGLNFKIVSDGGAKNSGDMVKALAIGADMMMTGSLLAGTPEAPGAIYEMNGIKYKEYAGSSTHKGNHVEGVKALVPLKSPVAEVIQSLVEGIRSGCAYQGVDNLEDLKVNPEFMEVSYSGFQNESKSHSVKIRE